ncbi:MAG: DUF192 domain-containing protein [Hyphomonadaceae bacterium]|nr:DUF192 domain-containing protein [Hyphomonadaceae bacterium]
MTRFSNAILLIGLIAAAPFAPVYAQEAAQPILEQSPLTIHSGEAEHVFTVELADDREEISTGMMFRTEMAPDAGMLFDLGEPRAVTFYMKNTLIPLDLLFVAPDGEILAIAENAEPLSLRLIDPGVAVKAVLEINGGQSAALAIQPGDRLDHPIFASASDG